ncbi:hypothetical protein HLK59_30585 [Streptomyces sp. S3(2020)]|uniref:hypothetical protein n=1 Tax=Streptomyces sp. S3(2020) TaxID=2732044 RepID=UPI0014884CDA|nr:hypothetical protein [Streptomyces sp. S3(2020)]NNN34632.1 hypothetical protein [Streptomyces sp. S3(2020)]
MKARVVGLRRIHRGQQAVGGVLCGEQCRQPLHGGREVRTYLGQPGQLVGTLQAGVPLDAPP